MLNRSALLSTMTTEMKYDAVLMYQTLFAQNHTRDTPSFPWEGCGGREEEQLHDMRVLFLKRLFITYAVCSVMFSSEPNGTLHQVWPYPLASVMCHGGRVLLELRG